eukprot:CAMPEP_0172311232 /NCGR_PEP_ID=MMETSP1058-20130122/14264_1 /TAXON_ID=83371 /ORGANISM="Detonula confervacea, Strain CCMP 353" /LENGTH=310 /DNA_ID=CAMNT_0013024351 /DNA_START=30 /DNA_END=962 /DNA_ORIENTATION=+
MRLLPIATALLTASSYHIPPSLAFVSSASSSASYHHLSKPSLLFLSALLAHNPRGKLSTIVAAASSSTAAEGNDSVADGECNATTKDSNIISNAPPLLSEMYDSQYPGTAMQRLRAVHERVSVIANDGTLNGPWEDARRRLLWAGGLKDLSSSIPGQGYTGHSFNDFNHVDLTTMNDDSSDNLNDGSVKGIAVGNKLGPGIRIASISELGPGGSWSTCAMGCNKDPPSDVAHVQFRSRVAFKLVWVPNEEYDTFVLVDDDGKLLAKGKPSDGPGALPRRREREMNYQIMKGSKYATVADGIALNSTTSHQ